MARKSAWRKKIVDACAEAGTYAAHYDLVIDQLAGIMETRDAAEKQFRATGGNPVVKKTLQSGAVNLVKNPALVVINECNQQALAYWRDLGLTPAGFKRINAGEPVTKEKDRFAEMLKNIGI